MRRFEKIVIIVGTDEDGFDFTDPSIYDWSFELESVLPNECKLIEIGREVVNEEKWMNDVMDMKGEKMSYSGYEGP
tara:strand:- start:307 stop:534 length:228 start_codon:yes stop_codon:yes gene_type:complete